MSSKEIDTLQVELGKTRRRIHLARQALEPMCQQGQLFFVALDYLLDTGDYLIEGPNPRYDLVIRTNEKMKELEADRLRLEYLERENAALKARLYDMEHAGDVIIYQEGHLPVRSARTPGVRSGNTVLLSKES